MRSLTFILFLPLILIGQNIFNVDFDAARFAESDSSGRIEIYYTFYYDGMQKDFLNGDSVLFGKLTVRISDYIRTKDSLLLNKSYQFEQKSGNDKSLTGVLKYWLLPGKYLCELKATDLKNTSSTDSVSFVFEINPASSKLHISDIQLASSLQKSENNASIFYKNGYEVIPNSSGLFGDNLPVIFFYSEIYNINDNSSSDFLTINYKIVSQYQKLMTNKSKKLPASLNSAVLADAINISKIPTGSYQLVIEAYNQSDLLNTSAKRFAVYNPDVIDSNTTVLNNDIFASEFATMTEEQLNMMYNYSEYIATKDEKQIWKSLQNLNEKKNFLFAFWKRRDNQSSDSINKYKMEYMKRVETANKRFESMQKPGWRTDRGRVYILYGEPDEIERYPEAENVPYEKWNYFYIEGGVFFIFAEANP